MARKSKRRTSLADTEAPDARTPERRFLDHLAVIEPLKADLDAKIAEQRNANAVYRTALKSAKREGVDIDAMVQMFKLRKMEPDDSTRWFHNLYHACIWGEVPIGGTRDLFAGKSPATAAEDKKIKAGTQSPPAAVPLKGAKALTGVDANAYHDGWALSESGQPWKQKFPEGTPVARHFENGYMDHQEKLGHDLQPGSGGNGKSKAEIAAEQRRAAKEEKAKSKGKKPRAVRTARDTGGLDLEQPAGTA